MNRTAFRYTWSALALAALIVPQSVAATCEQPFQRTQLNAAPLGQKTVGGGLGFGEGTTVLVVDGSSQFNAKLRLRGGIGICSAGSTAITFGVKLDTELFRSEDAKIGVFVGGGLSRVSFSGVGTLLVPITLHATYIVSPLTTIFGGPSFSIVRVSSGGISGSDSNLGLQGGASYQLNPTVVLIVGGDFQSFEFGSSFRIQAGAHLDIG